jgi:ribosomal protein S18 acetylase RimI-like enzyme
MNKIKITPINKKYKNEFIKAFNESYFDTEKETKQHFKEHINKNDLFLLFINSELAGFFDYLSKYSHDANYLHNLCIAKKFRNKGHSKHLLNKYIEISKKQKTRNTIALSSTTKINTASQKMHTSFGFKKIGTLKKLHYGKDEIFYAYDLK